MKKMKNAKIIEKKELEKKELENKIKTNHINNVIGQSHVQIIKIIPKPNVLEILLS